MAIKIAGTDVINDARGLLNIVSLDAGTTINFIKEILTKDTLAAGTTVRTATTAEHSNSSATPLLVYDWFFIQKGTIRIGFNARAQSASAGGVVYRIRDGVTTSVYAGVTTSATNVAMATDQSVLPGDIFQVLVRRGTSGKTSTLGYVSAIELRTSAGTYYVPMKPRAFDNLSYVKAI